MNTILLPTDFSDASITAGKYALGFAKQVNAKKIILYHTYVVPINFNVIPTEPILIDDDVADFEIMKESAINELKIFKEKLNTDAFPEIEIVNLINYGFFTEDIKKVQSEVNANIIILGINGGGAFTENIIGSDTVVVARQSTVPVIIVPNKSEYSGINKVALISDFVDVDTSVPTKQIKGLLDETKAQLHILHVAKNASNRIDKMSVEYQQFNTLFNGYNPLFHFEEALVFADGVNDFVESESIDLVIIIPKKHNLIESLFIKSHTKELAFHSHKPLLVVHS
jgi:nucleotide-binding universal stress UspA family protein